MVSAHEWVRVVTTLAKVSVPVGIVMDGGVVSREQAAARQTATEATVLTRFWRGIGIG
jgi:hypothetical protein